ncbi:MAG TPA: P-loop NTPase [Dehalococcoidia bacterium]|nr:P-loop NTPase [Dehalococcoidia bacterium]
MQISVASGKGGTGKTLVATSLALSLRDKYDVQLLDCDVEEPDDSIFVRRDIVQRELVYVTNPSVDENLCSYCGKCAEICAYHAIAVIKNHILTFSNLCHGCGACAYLCPESAITEMNREIGVIETGMSGNLDFVQGMLTVGEAMATPVIDQVKKKADNDKVVIIDTPPGTSCPVVHSVKGSDFCLLVTEPTPFGLNDLALAVETVKKLGIQCGVIINRSSNNDPVIENYCNEEDIPVLMKIPLDTEIARLYSKGFTLAEGMPMWKEIFKSLFENIEEIKVERTGSIKR